MTNNKLPQPIIGLGDNKALLKVYMANQPLFDFINAKDSANENISALESREIYSAGQACGNGWRKVFNVYAKFVFALSNPLFGDLSHYTKWQEYRDNLLLQAQSNTALLFTPPKLIRLHTQDDTLHIIMGKTYAKDLLKKHHLGNPDNMIWLNDEFAINARRRIIICPYFDYRQLSNIKILYLVNLIQSHFALKRS